VKLGRLEDGLEVFRELVRLMPKEGNNYLNAGILLSRLGRTGESIEVLEQGLSVAPDNRRIREALETTLKREALSRTLAFGRYRSMARKEPDERRRAAHRLKARGEAAKGWALFRKLIAHNPAAEEEVASTLGRLQSFLQTEDARAELGKKKMRKAEELLVEALKIDPRNPEAAALFVDLVKSTDDPGGKEERIRKVRSLADLGSNEVLEALLPLYEESGIVAQDRYDRGLRALRAGRAGEAAEHLGVSLEFGPGSPWTHYHLGAALERLGKAKKAADSYEKAAEILEKLLPTLEDEQKTLAEETLRSARETAERLREGGEGEKK
jgi:tetratricopeptide (TPR) repeat protein